MSNSLEIFKKITQVPRPSGKEDKIREFLIKWAESRGFKYRVDSYGNLVIYANSISNPESAPIILQAHMDMVCVKTADSSFDFDNDALVIYEEDGMLKARNTTLGADNGVGIALSMAVVDFEDRPNLEILVTVAEEIGLLGALNFDFSLVKGKYIINIDSENEEEICISSAGGARISITKELQSKNGKLVQKKLKIFGLKGGHSGVEIHKNHSNAAKLMIDFLSEYPYNFELSSISSGSADNVIPSKAEAIIGSENFNLIEESLKNFIETTKNKYDCPQISYEITDLNTLSPVIEDKDFILEKLKDVKIGVITNSTKIPDLVQTSMNLGILNIAPSLLEITYLPRSSDMKEFDELLKKLERIFKDSGYVFKNEGSYPGWQDDPNGKLVQIGKTEFEKVMGKTPKILAIHAGLECGALVAGLGDSAHAISIGPNMYDVHSVNERLDIVSVEKMELILKGILNALNK